MNLISMLLLVISASGSIDSKTAITQIDRLLSDKAYEGVLKTDDYQPTCLMKTEVSTDSQGRPNYSLYFQVIDEQHPLHFQFTLLDEDYSQIQEWKLNFKKKRLKAIVQTVFGPFYEVIQNLQIAPNPQEGLDIRWQHAPVEYPEKVTIFTCIGMKP